ncbi:MAG TPA: protein-methionine-sulfoxide reductase heme-binding subunit MsrQ [Blastocatellia bacterium]|nr:protein-methionine-sulfoxide reductase heme-binding subunit MsrQ [Blastocatellia bacterium]
MDDIRFAKFLILVNGLLPLVLMARDASRRNLGANPVEFIIHSTGILALVFLFLSLAVTPLRKVLLLPWLVKLRRMLGLFAFFYAFVHLVAYSGFDKSFNIRAIIEDTFKRPFITLGMAGFLLLLPLAITSTDRMVKRLGGKRWRSLHRAAYVAAVLGVLHFYMQVKADTRLPLLFGSVLGLLLAYRILNRFLPQFTERTPARAGTPPH